MAAPSKPGGILSRLRRDRRGVSAVEFALIAPIIIVFYLGLAEFCQGFMAQRRMGHVSATVADLITRSAATSGAELDDIFAVGELIMRPFSPAPLSQRATSVSRAANGSLSIDWSYGPQMGTRSSLAGLTISTDLLENGESLIVTEVTYDYDSPADYLLPTITRFSHTYYLKPRSAPRVTFQP
jgi:Flp pilus assembly protein TadG